MYIFCITRLITIMSTAPTTAPLQRRPARPVKPKLATPAVQVEPAAQEPTPVEPVVESVADSVAPVEAQTEAQDQSAQSVGKRQQLNKTTGVYISSARVRCHLDKLTLNNKIDSLIKVCKEDPMYVEYCSLMEKVAVEGASESAAEDVKKRLEELKSEAESVKAKLSALSHERVRFSHETPIVFAIICNEMVTQLFTHALEKTLSSKHSMVKVEHLHTDVEQLSLYPLFKSLPTFSRDHAKLLAESVKQSKDKELAAALSQAEKAFKKKYKVTQPRNKQDSAVVKQESAEASTEPSVSTEASVPEPSDEAEASLDQKEPKERKTTFVCFILSICNEVKQKLSQGKIRVSVAIRQYLSDMLVEFIQRMAPLVYLTAGCMKNKTINDVAVLHTVKSVMVDGCQWVESIELSKTDAEELKYDRVLSYVNSGYDSLESAVKTKLELINKHGEPCDESA